MEARDVRRTVTVLLAGLILGGIAVPDVLHRLGRSPVHPAMTRLALSPVPDATNKMPSGKTARATHARVSARLTKTGTAHFGLVALTWRGDGHGLRARVRVQEQGRWGAWHDIASAQDGPDAGSPDAQRAGSRFGTDPLLTSGTSDGVDVVVTTRNGIRPSGLHVVLIDGKRTAEDSATTAATSPWSNAAWADPTAPTIVSRAGWGADETLASGLPQYSPTIKIGFVHHTVTASNYPQAQAAAQVRAVYAYDTLGLGISDMGYNFLVDRFGTIYEGRAGGVDKAVIGAHTAGFNENSFAVAVLGDFQHDRPSSATLSAVVTAVGSVAGWKLGLFHRDPMAPVSLVSNGKYGTSRYEAGQVANIPYSLIGHGDIGSTACPGKYLRTQLALIRQVARAAQAPAIWSPQFNRSAWAWAPDAGTTVTATTSDRMDVTAKIFSACQPDPVRVLTVKQARAGPASVAWDGRDDAGTPVVPGRYTVQLSGVTDSGAVPWTTSDVVDIDASATSPDGPCDEVVRRAYAGTVFQSVAASSDTASKTIVVASAASNELANAVTAAVLARRLKARFVLADESGLPAASAAVLDTGSVTRAIVVSNSNRLASAIADLNKRGIASVEIVNGSNAATVSIAVMRKGWLKATTVVAVPVGSPAGVIAAAGTYAASRSLPLLLISTPAPAPKPSTSVGPSGTPSSTFSGSSSASASGSASASAGQSPTGSASNSASASATTSASTVTTPSASSTPVLAADLVAALRDVSAAATVLVGTKTAVAPAAFSLLPGPVVVSGSSTASVALAVAKRYKTPLASAVITNDASASRGYAVLAVLRGQPVLLMTTTLWSGTAAWLSTSGIKQVSLLGSRAEVSPDLVAPLVAALSPSPQPSPSDSQTATDSPSASSTSAAPSPTSGIPIAFAVNGAGFGHGIGMPQYGAQAQAVAGRTARDIIEYYYTGAKVKPVDDTATIRVNVVHQATSVTFRARGVDGTSSRTSDDPFAAVDLTTNDQSALTSPGDTFTATSVMTKSGPRLTLQRTDARGRTTVMGSYQSVLVRWGGTREQGAAGPLPAYIDIASPTESLGDGYGRYRYGTMTISAVAYTSGGVNKSGIEAVNSVRIHDEYLRGIGEVPASWKPAALQAQIIASRGYALSALRGGVKPGCDCNVYDNDQSQVFAGWTREVGYTAANALAMQRPAAAPSTSSANPIGSPSASPSSSTSGSGSPSGSASPSASGSPSNSSTATTSPSPSPTKPKSELPLPDYPLGRAWVKAVLATSPSLTTGLAATVGNSVIASYFYSASAGRTENSEDVWTTRLSWARSVPDPWCLDASVVPARLRSWQVIVTQSDAAAFFGVRDIVKIEVSSRTQGGAARTLVATSYRGGTATANAVSFRKQFDLKSRWLSSVAPYGGWTQPVTKSPSPTATNTSSASPSNSTSQSPSPSSSNSPTISPKPSTSASPTSSTGSAITVVKQPATTDTSGRVSVSVVVKRAPTAARVVLSRRVGSQWRKVSVASLTRSGRVSISGTLPEGDSTLRVELQRRGRVVTATSPWVVSVPRVVTVRAQAPKSVRARQSFEVAGTVSGAGAGLKVRREIQVGAVWQPRGTAVTPTAKKWRMTVSAPSTAGPLTYRVVAIDAAGNVVARSQTFVVRVR